jgi:LysM repeat protein
MPKAVLALLLMKTTLLNGLLAAGWLVLMSGCVTTQQALDQQAEIDSLRRDVVLMKERVTELSRAQQRYADEIARLQNVSDTRTTEMENQMAELNRMITSLAAASDKSRQEMLDQVSRKMSDIMKSQSNSGGGQKVERGYEHEVKAGETLSAIASAYGVSVNTIMKANNLKDSKLRSGQKLFIPD